MDVGQGDCEVIVSPTGTVVLIDAGNNGKGTSTVIPFLDAHGITKIDYVIASHYHADHIGGIDEVISHFGTNNLTAAYDRGGTYSSLTYDSYYDAISSKRQTINPGQVIDLGGNATITCIAVGGKTTAGTIYSGSDENHKSVIVRLDYCDFQMYLGGDAGDAVEPFIMDLVGDVDVYKVSHHGSDTASTTSFIGTILPEVSTIPVGTNSYGHPTTTIINRLISFGSYIYQTEAGDHIPPAGQGEAANGNFKINTDGGTYTVSGASLTTRMYDTDGSHDPCGGETTATTLLFSEILYDSDVIGDSAGEWIEIYNNTNSAVNLSGWTINDNVHTYQFANGTSIGSKSYMTLAADEEVFIGKYGGAPHLSNMNLQLSNTGDYLILKNTYGETIDQVAWENGGVHIAGWGSTSHPMANEDYSIQRKNFNTDTNTYTDWSDNQTPDPAIYSTVPSGYPEISLNKTQLSFGAAGSINPQGQEIIIGNSGNGILNWNISSDVTWMNYLPTSGTGSKSISVGVNALYLDPGTYEGHLTITAPNATNSPQVVDVSLVVYDSGTTVPPFGEFATPIEGSTVSSSIPVTGWVLDDLGVAGVKIYRASGNSLVYIGDAVFVAGARPDVEQAYPGYPMNDRAGWGYMLLTNFLPNGGNGTYTLHAVATDYEGHAVNLGMKTITVDNAHAVKPFGAIDTPLQGDTISGSTYVDWGWALTPQPNSIPTNGSTISVWVDGKNIGSPNYNIYRSDIASMFPGYANSNGAVGYHIIDTTSYENGIHTITWIVRDSGGNTDGIGSRYFNILNEGSNREATDQGITLSNYIKYDGPVFIRHGYDTSQEFETRYPGENGELIVNLAALGRLELKFAHGKVIDVFIFEGGVRRTLPPGFHLDTAKGLLTWQPGFAFSGRYCFRVILEGEEIGIGSKGIGIEVNIQ